MRLFQAVVFLSGKAGFDLLKHSVYVKCILLYNSITCCVVKTVRYQTEYRNWQNYKQKYWIGSCLSVF